ncbi:hypothetical protein [Nostoc sp. C117]|uniref:hypothetical protein n=1 Tax=Nostoc sp. C117 TaxID=3349875 RepID=UPI00370DCD7E
MAEISIVAVAEYPHQPSGLSRQLSGVSNSPRPGVSASLCQFQLANFGLFVVARVK